MVIWNQPRRRKTKNIHRRESPHAVEIFPISISAAELAGFTCRFCCRFYHYYTKSSKMLQICIRISGFVRPHYTDIFPSRMCNILSTCLVLELVVDFTCANVNSPLTELTVNQTPPWRSMMYETCFQHDDCWLLPSDGAGLAHSPSLIGVFAQHDFYEFERGH